MRIHMIGINGISMSGLAEILVNSGYQVTGSDLVLSTRTDKLKKMGVKIYEGHNPENVHGSNLVVYTSAVKKDNLEYKEAKKLLIPLMERAVLLGKIMDGYNTKIAVSGTHGKTTTSALASYALVKSGMNPTAHIGAYVKDFGGTTLIGQNNIFLAEACEYSGSFLNLKPDIAVILNIELDHVDYYKDIEDVKSAFIDFCNNVKKNGCIIACMDDKNVMGTLKNINRKKVTYSIENPAASIYAKDISFDNNSFASFDIVTEKKPLGRISLSIPGIHNVLNSLAAAAVCFETGADILKTLNAISSFKGADQRFEFTGEKNNIKIYNDYAHHPTEIKATLNAVKNMEYNKLWCVFQPHTYSRTKAFLNEFASSLSLSDKVLVTDIYAAREKNPNNIHSKDLVEKLKQYDCESSYMNTFEEIANHILKKASAGDIVITMGAGDIFKVGKLIVSRE